MNTVWARRREELLSDCIVSPNVFHQMVDRLGEFVIPYHTVHDKTFRQNLHDVK
jgi:hypothetical protein